MHDRALIDVGEAFIGAADIEAELVGGELAHGEHGFELGANVGRKIAAREGVVDRLAVPQDAAFFVGGARKVASGEQKRRENYSGDARQECSVKS